MACAPCASSTPSDQFKCWLDELKIVYTDCDGNVHGDCGMCAGAGNSGTQTNTIAFNPGNNLLTSIVDGIASSTPLSFDTGDITLATALTINGVLYPIGTLLQTVLAAIVAISHTALTLDTGNNPALILNSGAQKIKLNLSQSGSYDNTISGLVSDNIKGAIDEVAAGSIGSGLPAGTIGEVLIHNGTDFVSVLPVLEEITGITTAVINLANPPLAFPVDPFTLHRGGFLMSSPGDYTRVAQVVTLASAALAGEIFDCKYYI